MKAVVVYESLWGNTAAIAAAIAEGIGGGTRALSTAEGTPEVIGDVDLIVAGSPVFGLKLPSEKMRDAIAADPGPAPSPPDTSHPSMRSWLEELPKGDGHGAAFDTQVRGPFGKAAPTITRKLARAGYPAVAKPEGFIVTGRYGPLADGEIERAREWGQRLAASIG